MPEMHHQPAASRRRLVWRSSPSARVDAWVNQGPIDLMLVIGTQASVYPAAGYIHVARLHGARVAVVDMERRHENDIRAGAG